MRRNYPPSSWSWVKIIQNLYIYHDISSNRAIKISNVVSKSLSWLFPWLWNCTISVTCFVFSTGIIQHNEGEVKWPLFCKRRMHFHFFLNENHRISIPIALNVFPRDLVDNKWVLVEVIVCNQAGHKPRHYLIYHLHKIWCYQSCRSASNIVTFTVHQT